ncbi:MAG: DUF3168 domain-containing protein [Tannerellaceae bacterium]|nr:DUF3168 domain-containing protein [Tannerellaceae bacterium]
MKDGVDVGVLIYNELIRDQEIKKMVRGNIHPLVVKKDIPYPFVVYQRTELEAVYSKDRVVQDKVTMQIDCVSDSYSECVQLASWIRKNLDHMMKRGKLYIRLANAEEEASGYAFIQRLFFTIKINY